MFKKFHQLRIMICIPLINSVLHRSKLYWIANEESLQTKKILAKKICKENDAKKANSNIGNKSLILHLFRRKIANIL